MPGPRALPGTAAARGWFTLHVGAGEQGKGNEQDFTLDLGSGLMMTGAAFAQTGTGTGTSTGSGATGGSATSTTTTTTITPQQESTIKTYVTKEKTKSVAVPSGFTLSTGATVPQTVELHSFGSDVGMTQYRYVVMNNRTVIVDPSTRKVIKVID